MLDIELIFCAKGNQKNLVSRPTTSCLHWCSNISLQVFRWKIVDTFYIQKWSADDHTFLGFTRLLEHLERKWEQFCNLGSVSEIMNKKYTNKVDFWFSICTTYNLPNFYQGVFYSLLLSIRIKTLSRLAYLCVPSLKREAMSDCQPVPVHFIVCRATKNSI